MSFKNIVEDIQSLKIQGAESVAKSAVLALVSASECFKTNNVKLYNHELIKAKIILFKSRPTEPALRNALNSVLYRLGGKDVREQKQQLKFRAHKVLSHFEYSKNQISTYGARLIKNNSIVYTHCHSSTVVDIIREAAKTKHFEVHNTETRPLYQGRKTSLEISKLNIPVYHYVDSGARLALKKADIMFLGADAITSLGKVINKIGSELIAESAERYDVPVYICTNSWKFDNKTTYGFEEPIENRSRKEVWPDAPKNIKIMNPAFESIDPELIAGIISELGILPVQAFIEETKKKYEFLNF